jgi:hypothetical protein
VGVSAFNLVDRLSRSISSMSSRLRAVQAAVSAVVLQP